MTSETIQSKCQTVATQQAVFTYRWNTMFDSHLMLIHSKELREGALILVEKLKKYKPLIAVFNGKCK